MLIEAMKRRINAVTDEQNALNNLMGAKISNIWKRIGKKQYTIDGRKFVPAQIKWYESSFQPCYCITITFLCVPSELLKDKKLTDTERKKIREYEKSVFNKFSFDVQKSNLNEVLLDKVHRDFHWELYNCRNKIRVCESREWKYDLEDITSDSFVRNGMTMDSQFLW